MLGAPRGNEEKDREPIIRNTLGGKMLDLYFCMYFSLIKGMHISHKKITHTNTQISDRLPSESVKIKKVKIFRILENTLQQIVKLEQTTMCLHFCFVHSFTVTFNTAPRINMLTYKFIPVENNNEPIPQSL